MLQSAEHIMYSLPRENERGALCMKGGIYSNHRGGWQVRFGRKLTKSFKDLGEAERFLNGLRFKTDEGTFDIRDYQSSHPLGFATLVQKWLAVKRNQVRPSYYSNLNNYMTRAVTEWGQSNIKTIQYGHIEDFLYRQPKISDKTRHNIKIALQEFFKWISKRERIPMPDFLDTPYELGWRNIIDINTQQNVINEVREISYVLNPKIWLGIKWLATYVSVRPGELISIREKQVNLGMGGIVIPHPKEKAPKIVYLLQEDIEYLRAQPTGFPDLWFFRHSHSKGVKKGSKFGNGYLYKWWKRACANLGIEGVDLYGGTRHSTVTALGKICTPEEVKDATGHVSEAFERYFQGKQARALKVTERIKTLHKPFINIDGEQDKDKVLKFKG